MIPQPNQVDLRAIEQPLQRQLLAMALVVLALGTAVIGWRWGVAAAAGVVAAMAYYRLLAAQVSRQFARGRAPNMLLLIGALAGRQFLCLAVPTACFFTLGTAWLASLVTLVFARHWIMIVAWRGGAPAALAAS